MERRLDCLGSFRRVYIRPAAYDGGTSVGAAYHVWHQVLGRPRGFVMDHAHWGPEFGDARLKRERQPPREQS